MGAEAMNGLQFDPLVPVPVLVAVAVAFAAAAWLRVRRGRYTREGVVRWSAMGLLVLFAAADPAIGGGRAAVKRSDANVLFVVDTTGSMAAQDYNGDEPRLVGVRHDVIALADEFSGATFALVTWNSKTRLIVPWTTDRGALDSAVQLLRQEWTQYAQGTRLDEPIAMMRELLPRSGPHGGYDIVFYLSDGEHNLRPAPQSFERLNPTVAGGAVLGYGTTEGARMNVYVGRDEDPVLYIHDYDTGEPAVSRIDEANLNRIADELGVAYFHRPAATDVEEIADQSAEQVGTVYAGERDTARRLYWLPAFGVIAIVAWQLATTAVEVVDDRRALGRRARRATS
jgi:Ca-activated chloride channel family protein